MLSVLCLIGLTVSVAAGKSFSPDLSITGKSGLRIKLADEDGISFVIFTVRQGDQSRQYVVETTNDDDNWEHIDTDANTVHGEMVEVQTHVLYNDKWVTTEWIPVTLLSESALRPSRRIRSYTLFRDDYNTHIDPYGGSHYTTDITSWGGGNGEFQVYVPEKANIFTRGGYLYLKPTFTVDHPQFDNGKLYHGRMDLNTMYHKCTNGNNWGCDRTSFGQEILPPIMSGKLTTKPAIKYGRVNVRAMIPKGDWLWPAIWMLPRDNRYGGWPRSGEIDLMESRGNTRAHCGNKEEGIRTIGSTLHWGPSYNNNKYYLTHGEKTTGGSNGYHGWHTYSLDWTDRHIIISVDGSQVLRVDTPWNGFYGKGGFTGENPWAGHGKNAPFDEYFHLILNVAVGGGYFSDGCSYNTPKPWHGGSSHPMRDFWEKRGTWQPTWHGDDVAMLIDYVEMIQY